MSIPLKWGLFIRKKQRKYNDLDSKLEGGARSQAILRRRVEGALPWHLRGCMDKELPGDTKRPPRAQTPLCRRHQVRLVQYFQVDICKWLHLWHIWRRHQGMSPFFLGAREAPWQGAVKVAWKGGCTLFCEFLLLVNKVSSFQMNFISLLLSEFPWIEVLNTFLELLLHSTLESRSSRMFERWYPHYNIKGSGGFSR